MLVAVIWIVEIVNFFLGHSLRNWGILPRSFTGLIGIPLAPFIHAGFWHSLSNTIPLLILGGLTLASGSSSCAVAVAAARRGLTSRAVTIDLDGGTLYIDWREDGVWMTGPTAHVFDGVWRL